MIAEFTIENFFSIKSPQKISFEPSSDNFMSDEYSYEVKDGIRLLKLGIIYGANASGKTNILNAVAFFRMLKAVPIALISTFFSFNALHISGKKLSAIELSTKRFSAALQALGL